MTEMDLIPVYHVDDVPHFANLAEAVAFWDGHSITEEYVAEARERGLIPQRPHDRVARRNAAREQTESPH